MILSVLCIYNHYTFTWYHWFGSIGSLEKVNFPSNSTYHDEKPHLEGRPTTTAARARLRRTRPSTR